MANRFTIGGYQEQGGRSYQEDRYYSDSMVLGGTKVFVLAIADGMGGHKAGDIASELAIKEVRKYFSNFEFTDFQNLKAELYDVFSNANHAILNHSKIYPAAAGLGTTLTCAVIINQQMIVAHIGDSRAFLVTDGNIFQCTKDHTAYQEALDSGVDVSKINVGANALTRCLDGGNDYEPDLSSIYNVEQALVFLCSDGLYNAVPVHDLENIARESDDSNLFSRRAVKQAVENGAGDNVSVVTYADSERTILPVGSLAKSTIKRYPIIKKAVLLLALVFIVTAAFGLYRSLSVEEETLTDEQTEQEEQESNEREQRLTNSDLTEMGESSSNITKDDRNKSIEPNTWVIEFVDINPSDARIEVTDENGNIISADVNREGRAEYNLAMGRYKYSISRSGYKTRNEEFIVENEPQKIPTSSLEKMKGVLVLKIEPDNTESEIEIINKATAEVEKVLNSSNLESTIQFDAGEYEISISSDNYESIERSFSIKGGEQRDLEIKLVPLDDPDTIEDSGSVGMSAEPNVKDDRNNIDSSESSEILPFYVNLFSSKVDSKTVKKYLSEISPLIGIKYYERTEIVKLGDLWKLVIGPYETHDEAESAKDELSKILQEKINEDSEKLFVSQINIEK